MRLKLYKRVTHTVRYFLLRRLPNCKDMSLVMSQSMERRLTLHERAAMKLHLLVCIWCVWYLEHLHFIRENLRTRAEQLPGEESSATDSLSADARDRIRRALSEKAQ
jgi:hypothetical protein